jgi:hypothetical protein
MAFDGSDSFFIRGIATLSVGQAPVLFWLNWFPKLVAAFGRAGLSVLPAPASIPSV